MTTLVYYRQKRVDGGIRTGIELDGDTLVSHFVEGSGERDPALIWYVDIRCKGRALPKEDNAAIQWLVDNARTIQSALETAAGEFSMGIDSDEWPVKIPIVGLPKGTEGYIVCSAIHRINGREIAKVLKSIATDWTRLLRRAASSKAVYA